MKKSTLKILGIDFFNGQVKDVVQELKSGGLMVVPAAPALITIKSDTAYYKSLLDSDVVIADSGYMVLIWNLFNKQKHFTCLYPHLYDYFKIKIIYMKHIIYFN